MARMHGKDVRVYLNERDVSGDFASVNFDPSCETHDVTVFSSGGSRAFDPGLLAHTASLDGFYQPDSGGIGQQLETAGLATVLSVYDGDADAIGEKGFFCSGLLEKRDQPISVADLIKLTATVKGTGRAGLDAVLLHILEEETGTGSESSYDGSASSSNGGTAALHVTAISGTWTIVVEHSADNVTFATLATFTQRTTTGAERIEFTGTVNRYLRVSFTEDVAGSITFVAGAARY